MKCGNQSLIHSGGEQGKLLKTLASANALFPVEPSLYPELPPGQVYSLWDL
jgi:hypothetical protein